MKNKLTDKEISVYIKEANNKTGVRGITKEILQEIRLNKVHEVYKTISNEGSCILVSKMKKEIIAHYDSFTPRSASYAFKPSFAGQQVLLGREGRKLYFSNGRWFSGRSFYTLKIEE